MEEHLKEKLPEQLVLEIEDQAEWLETSEGDEIECISIESLVGILKNYTLVKNEQ